jgi:hypothetical protein
MPPSGLDRSCANALPVRARAAARAPSRHRPAISRRASILIALILVLIIVQIAVIGVVSLGSKDHSLTKLRLEASQSEYASEAGVNMALREVYDGADEDGDGTIGSISAKTINGASVSVSASVSGSTTTLTSTAAAATAKRATQLTITGGASTRVYTSQSTNAAVYQTSKSGSSWSSPASSGSTNAQPVWIAAAAISTGKAIVAAMDTGAHLNIGAAGSTGTATYTDACSDLFGVGTRSFDVATDVAHAKGVIAYWNNSATALRYRTHDGTTLSGESNIAITLAGGEHVETVRMNSRGTASGIVMMVGTDASALWGAVWTGSSWTSVSKLATTLSTSSYGPFDACYEVASGDILAVYCDGSNNIVYRTYSGSWSSATTVGTSGYGFRWIRLASRPGADDISAVGLDSSGGLWAGRWNGSAWVAFTQIASGCAYSDRRLFDVCSTPDGTQTVIAYAINGSNIYYRTWSGSSWSGQTTGPNLGATVMWVQLAQGVSGTDVQCIASTSARKLYYTSWTGSAFSSATAIQNSLSTEDDHERFAIIPGSGSPTVTAWEQIAP